MARTTIAEGFHILPGMGNCLAAETDAGMVIVDGGPVGVARVCGLRRQAASGVF
jgi:hypothetical protein